MKRFVRFTALSLVGIFVLFSSSPCFSQDSSLIANRKALSRYSDSSRVYVSPNSERSLGEELRLDTVDEIIISKERQEKFLSMYRGWAYLRYFNDWTGIDEFDDLETSSIAEKMLIFQSTSTITRYLSQSPLADVYRDFIRMAREYRHYTTLNVHRSGGGNMNVSQGSSSSQSLVKFKLSINARQGIEPRITFGENLVLKHDLFEETTLLEYGFNF